MSDTPRSLLVRLAESPIESDWRRLVDLYQPFIDRWLCQAGILEFDRSDLCQDVLTAVVKELAGFRHSERVGAFRNWLRKVVVNRSRNYWRSKNRQENNNPVSSTLDELEDPSSGLSGIWDREHDAYVTRKLLTLLEREFAPTTWTAFQRHVIDGNPAADVSRELGLSVNAVLIAKSRILRRLREEAVGLVDEL
ncbi:MAG: sigma-70 family RNA polymerase sigma factor [Gemmataceae bacterium]